MSEITQRIFERIGECNRWKDGMLKLPTQTEDYVLFLEDEPCTICGNKVWEVSRRIYEKGSGAGTCAKCGHIELGFRWREGLLESKTQPFGEECAEVDEKKYAPRRRYSELLNDYLWLVRDETQMKQLLAKGVREAIYTADQIRILRNKPKEYLDVLHHIKKVLPGTTVRG
jgi:excinuclease UvrABC ATPase subunit